MTATVRQAASKAGAGGRCQAESVRGNRHVSVSGIRQYDMLQVGSAAHRRQRGYVLLRRIEELLMLLLLHLLVMVRLLLLLLRFLVRRR